MKRSIGFALTIVLSFTLGVVGVSFARSRGLHFAGLTVKFENDRVRVLELRLQPGERENQHMHPQYVLYALTNYRVRNTSADGTVRTFERKAGDVFWGEPITHGGQNIGNTELRALIVELKPH